MSNDVRSTAMQTWEYLFVFAAITSGGGEFRPRFANDQELDDWQAGATMYDYANQLGERGWELFSCHPQRLYTIKRATIPRNPTYCIGSAGHRDGFQTTQK